MQNEKEWMTLGEVQEKFGQLASFKEIFYDWMGLNKWLFLQINHIRAPFYDDLMVWVTELGNRHHFPYILALLFVFALFGTLYKKIKKQGGAKQYAVRWTGIFVVLAVGFAANAIVITGMKAYFSMPRPYAVFNQSSLIPATEKLYQLEKREPEEARHSFPSGHVAFITLMIVALWPILTEGFRYFGLFLIFAVAWSRISLGVHFPADALWSFVIASLIVIAVRNLSYKAMRALFRINC